MHDAVVFFVGPRRENVAMGFLGFLGERGVGWL